MRAFCYPKPRSSEITPRHLFERRREFLRQSASGLALAAAPALWSASAWSWTGRLGDADPTEFTTEGDKTPKEAIKTYNNFFEFGTGKDDPHKNAHKLQTDPWSLEISGEVEKSGTFGLEDVLKHHSFEERIYRLRCVEAWSMVIPWVGFPLADLLKRHEPTSRAKYAMFETLHDPEQMPAQRRDILDWPYREGLRMDEAMHPLTILAVGLYGDVLPNQNGAPIRLVVPWKYGYKSIKSIVRIHLQEKRPVSTWEAERPNEYGFYAIVDPEVRHPRWHQATERRIGEDGRRRTEKFNGYGEHVAHLYEGMDLSEYR
ncbi:protein-methionine-sulfoxide reductase catalytic subunit MsrP [Aquisalimonas sp.]|uniref:protein-methionine-sulfoxide reductase catalytic subunit MsrP n=1 Tax=Aquisalimonas sp. TaxID=1872621 RepID=UPI0025BD8095|nr:protein-methionine-sulfoxide reductase catalytic subunit MsrP [Aquisalimonas sp.]